MALVDIPLTPYPMFCMWDTFLPTTAWLIDASGEGAGQVVQTSKAGTITHICWKTGAVTTSDTVDVRLETVNASGQPSGTLADTTTNGSQGSLVANTWYETALTSSYTATQGETLAVVVEHGGTANFEVMTASGTYLENYRSHLAFWHDSGAGWSAQSTVGGMFGSLKYNDGTYPYAHGLIPHTDGTVYLQNTAWSTVDEHRGLKFQVPFRCRAAGVQTQGDIDNSDWKATLWGSDGATVLATTDTQDTDTMWNTRGMPFFFNSTGGVLEPDTWYRVTMGIVTSTANQIIDRWSVDSVALRDGYWGKAHYTASNTHPPTQESHWTDTTTEIFMMRLLLDQIDTGGGGAVIMPPALIY